VRSADVACSPKLGSFSTTTSEAGSVAAIDDLLDAAIAAWTARRVVREEAAPMPDPPQVFSDGIPSAIWTRPRSHLAAAAAATLVGPDSGRPAT
jgi:hypothetical protein